MVNVREEAESNSPLSFIDVLPNYLSNYGLIKDILIVIILLGDLLVHNDHVPIDCEFLIKHLNGSVTSLS